MSRKMIYLLFASVALGAVGSVAGSINGPKCGFVHLKTDTSLVRIEGGREARPGSWPWMVTVYRPEKGNTICGGSVIDDQFVLTAAHCLYFEGKRMEIFNVVAGDHRLSTLDGHEQKRSVVGIWVHPQFSIVSLVHDIALLQLDYPLQFNQRVGPVCLPKPGEELEPGLLPTVTGWGSNSRSLFSDTLQQVRLPVVEPELCNNLQEEQFICAGYKNSFPDACEGDSGGPLVLEEDGYWYQYGVVSHGPPCSPPTDGYGSYAKTSANIGWIARIINENRLSYI